MALEGVTVVASNSELTEFVREALTRGTPRGRVEDILMGAGWSRDVVQGALAGYADVEFPIPVPKPKAYLSARETFLYLLLFTTLYVAAFNMGVLVFQYIDSAFPDAASPYYAVISRQVIRWSLSALLVAFPVFLYLSTVVGAAIRKDPVKRRSHVRRWAMYLTVFIAASILLGDVTTLVYNALGGELTTRFVLKVLTIAAMTGAILGYYLADLKLEDTKPEVSAADDSRRQRLYGGLAVIAVLAVSIVGFVMIGAPGAERSRRMDAQQVSDLRQISNLVTVYFGRHQRLPVSLDELAREGGLSLAAGPSPVHRYEYRVVDEKTYELCADFQWASDDVTSPNWAGDFWTHGRGRQCFRPEVKGTP
jgi:Domain of unknown function (DUF5671)